MERNKQNFNCFFGLHKYEILKEEKLVNPNGIQVGIIFISRCTNCGKLKTFIIYTDSSYGRY